MKKLLSMLLVLVMMAALAVGCASPAEQGGDVPAADAPAASGRTDANVQIFAEPDTLDIHRTAAVISHALCRDIYAGLVRMENGEIVADLAESWEWNADYTEITFQLKEGILFSDGTPITAEDVVYSFNRGIEAGFGTYYVYIENLAAKGEREVVITLNQPYSVFLSSMCTTYFSVMSKAAVEAGMDVGFLPNVTSGAYYVEKWETGAGITLKANPNYYRGEAAVKDVELLFMTDENTALIALESGDIDYMMGGAGTLAGSSIQYLEGVENCSLLPFASTAYNFLSLNQNVEYFADKNVRKAIDCAINREDIILAALDGYGTPAGIPVLPSLGGYVDGFAPTAYDVEAAKQYMAASAYPNGFTFTIQACSDQWTKVAQVIQSELKEIGITVNIEEMEVGTVITNMSTNNYEAAIMSWANGSGDVSNTASMYIQGDALCFAGLKDNRLGELFDESLRTTDAERDAVLKEAYTIIMDEVPYVSLFWPTSYYATAKGLTVGAEIGLLGDLQLYSMSWD